MPIHTSKRAHTNVTMHTCAHRAGVAALVIGAMTVVVGVAVLGLCDLVAVGIPGTAYSYGPIELWPVHL